MTVVVRFQLIFLNKLKYVAFRDLSSNRHFQELLTAAVAKREMLKRNVKVEDEFGQC